MNDKVSASSCARSSHSLKVSCLTAGGKLAVVYSRFLLSTELRESVIDVFMLPNKCWDFIKFHFKQIVT